MIGEGPLIIRKPPLESLYFTLGFCFGSANEPDGKHGINHLLEHMLVSQLEGNLQKVSHQVICDGFSDTQLLRLDIRTVRQNLESVIDAVSSLYTTDSLNRNAFEKEKPAILGASELTSDPYYTVLELARRTVFDGSNFSHPPDGYRNEIESITLEDCNSVWQSLKHDYRSVAGFCGDFINNKPIWISGTKTAPEENWQFSSIQSGINLGIQGAECCLGTFISDADPVLLDFIAFITGGSAHSLLFGALRNDSGLAYDTRSLVNHFSTGSLIRLYFGLDDRENIGKTSDLIWKTFDRLEIDEKMLAFYKEAFRCTLVFEMDNPERFLAKSVYRKMIGAEHNPEEALNKLDSYDIKTVSDKFKSVFRQDNFSVSVVK